MMPGSSIRCGSCRGSEERARPGWHRFCESPALCYQKLLQSGRRPAASPSRLKTHLHILQALAAFLAYLPTPSSWRRPVVERVARTLVFSGVEALPLLLLMGAGLGALAAQQGELWLSYTKRPDLLYNVVNAGLVREVAPLLSVLLVLAASGAPMCSEMAMMKVTREMQVLRCQGIPEFTYLVFPRMCGLALSCCCGSVVLVTAALCTCSVGLTGVQGDPTAIAVLQHLLLELQWQDAAWMLIKASCGGATVAVVACMIGLSAGEARTEVPRMVARGMSQALMWVTAGWIIVTVASYMI